VPEATAVPTITVAAPRSDPGRRTVVPADLFRPREHRSAIAWASTDPLARRRRAHRGYWTRIADSYIDNRCGPGAGSSGLRVIERVW